MAFLDESVREKRCDESLIGLVNTGAIAELIGGGMSSTAYIYCQQMQDLPNTHPQVNRSFLNGLHVVRRSDRFWAGLSTDLIIEQVLMCNVKTTGGLTRGRGMSETQRLV